jgi:glycosyltransferase involved in cell wall biosynthesis
MKYLTVAIPCYNSYDYMSNAIESALICKEDIEIIIVNDGSKDKTNEIGEQYAAMYPDTVKYVYQENGGHGEAVNTGLKNASGIYFKVLDSDDWFDKAALVKVVETLKDLYQKGDVVDMMIANYVYEKPSANKSSVIKYTNALPTNKIFRWYNVKYFYPQQNLLMHSVIYRLQLPKHTFYVDNLFVYQPLPYVNTLYYLNVDLYRYFIGREDQSVNESIMISRIDQQLKVNKLMIDCCDVMSLKSRKLRNYMIKYLTMITTVSSVLLVKSGTEENLKKRDELWSYLKINSPEVYKAVKHTLLGSCMEMNSEVGKKLITTGYSISQKIFGFN